MVMPFSIRFVTRARRLVSSLVLVLLVPAGCDDAKAEGDKEASKSGKAQAKAPAEPAEDPKLAATRKAAVDRIEASDKALSAIKSADWPKACPPLTGELFLTTIAGLRQARGVEAPKEHAYHHHQLTPPLFFELASDARGYETAKWEQLGAVKYFAVARVTAHQPAELFDEDGKPLEALDALGKKQVQFKPGKMDAWLYVVDAEQGKGLCALTATVSHDGDFESKATVTDELDDYLRTKLVADLAAKVAETGATLVDDTGPVTESKHYQGKFEKK